MMSGTSWAKETRPTCSDEWVIEKVWKGMATIVIWLPRLETKKLSKRRRKSRLSFRGSRSTMRREGI